MKRQLRRLAASLRRDDNPLRRRVDRAEKAALAGLVVVVLFGWLAAAVIVGRAADNAGLGQERADRGWQEVPATLQASAAQVMDSTPIWGAPQVPASWRLHGQRHTGLVTVELNARAGQRVMVWVDRAGQLTGQPVSGPVVEDAVVFAVLSVTTGAAVVLVLAICCLKVLFDRRRMTGWQRAWDAVGPTWSRQG